jgi:hypothetical protein
MSSYEVCNATLFLVELSKIEQFRKGKGAKDIPTMGREPISSIITFQVHQQRGGHLVCTGDTKPSCSWNLAR